MASRRKGIEKWRRVGQASCLSLATISGADNDPSVNPEQGKCLALNQSFETGGMPVLLFFGRPQRVCEDLSDYR